MEEFIQYSLSVHNRRKSRVGRALEHHVEAIFSAFRLKFERGARTEGNSKPDFLFPGRAEYRNRDFDPTGLTMLGVKSTCKDRWRQVPAEAQRIQEKHLLTLEPGISVSQTREMRFHHLHLVVPAALHPSFSPQDTGWLLSLREFIALVKRRQNRG